MCNDPDNLGIQRALGAHTIRPEFDAYNAARWDANVSLYRNEYSIKQS